MKKESDLDTVKKIISDLWNEFGVKALIACGVILLIFVSGGLYRAHQDKPFWGTPETAIEREDRLRDCAQLAHEQLSPTQQLDSHNSKVCSGFTNKEIEETRSELGL